MKRECKKGGGYQWIKDGGEVRYFSDDDIVEFDAAKAEEGLNEYMFTLTKVDCFKDNNWMIWTNSTWMMLWEMYSSIKGNFWRTWTNLTIIK